MKRRVFLTGIGATALSGCLNSAEQSDGDSPPEDRNGQSGPNGSTTATVEDVRLETRSVELPIRADGEVRREIKIRDGGGSLRTVPVAVHGAEDVFSAQTFARYVVELVDGETVIGRTASAINACNYRWQSAQTETTLFVSRHPSVRDGWDADCYLGTDNVTAPVEHDATERVFEVDISDVALEQGVYQYFLGFGTDYGLVPSIPGQSVSIGHNPRGTSEREAIETASGPVRDANREELGPERTGRDGLRFMANSGYSYSADSEIPNASDWLKVTRESSEPLVLDAERKLRVQNLATDHAVTLTAEGDAQ